MVQAKATHSFLSSESWTIHITTNICCRLPYVVTALHALARITAMLPSHRFLPAGVLVRKNSWKTSNGWTIWKYAHPGDRPVIRKSATTPVIQFMYPTMPEQKAAAEVTELPTTSREAMAEAFSNPVSNVTSSAITVSSGKPPHKPTSVSTFPFSPKHFTVRSIGTIKRQPTFWYKWQALPPWVKEVSNGLMPVKWKTRVLNWI